MVMMVGSAQGTDSRGEKVKKIKHVGEKCGLANEMAPEIGVPCFWFLSLSSFPFFFFFF